MEGQCGRVGPNNQVVAEYNPMAEDVASTLSRQRAWGQQLEASQQEDAQEGRGTSTTSDSIRQKNSTSQQNKEQELLSAATETKEQVEKTKKAAQFARTVMRVINGTEIVSVVGILLAIVTMHYRLIFGNLLNGAILPAPKLAGWEMALLAILDIFVAVIVGFLIGLIMMMLSLNPLSTIGTTGTGAQATNPSTWQWNDPTSKL